MERHHAEVLAQVARETGNDLPVNKRGVGDPRTARGIPIAGFRGAGGTAPGTQPERELLREEGRRERNH